MDSDTPETHTATALDLLHATVQQVEASDLADPAAALRTVYQALSLTATANRLIDKAMLDFGQVYWPGENFLTNARCEYLDLAVQQLESALPIPIGPLLHDEAMALTPPEMEPQVYQPFQPDGYDGVVCDPDPTERDRQRLLLRTQAVASTNQTVWATVRILLGDLLDHVSDPQQRKTCRIAALLVDEVLNHGPRGGRDDIHQRILAIEKFG